MAANDGHFVAIGYQQLDCDGKPLDAIVSSSIVLANTCEDAPTLPMAFLSMDGMRSTRAPNIALAPPDGRGVWLVQLRSYGEGFVVVGSFRCSDGSQTGLVKASPDGETWSDWVPLPEAGHADGGVVGDGTTLFVSSPGVQGRDSGRRATR